MCGIAGFFNSLESLPEKSLAIVKAMGNIQAHRGPDDAGEYIARHCAMSFRRLSIIDLASGHQPMFSPSGQSVIVFNGEIYNYLELKRTLESGGVVFKTNSDTEVIIAGYEAWGEALLDKLRGIFSFAIYDIKNIELFCARDHTGVKPFYYSLTSNNFVFASEIKALLLFPSMTKNLNEQALPKYMSFLWVPAPDTLFKNIFMLNPGHFIRVSKAGIQKRRYWNPDLSHVDSLRNEHEWIEWLDSELLRCVREQLISEVSYGAFLSGGLDSTVIIAYMKRIVGAPITTFTTGFGRADLAEDVIGSDLHYARIAQKELGVDYNELILKTDVVSLLPKIVWHMDEPIADPAAITTYLICRAAKNKCTVMLSGVGGDEIFGGYPRYLANALATQYARIPHFFRSGIIEPLITTSSSGANRVLRNLKKFVRSASLPFRERYLGYLSYYSQEELNRLLLIHYNWNDIFENHQGILNKNQCTSEIQTMMNLDLETFLPNLNLLYTDKMSSAHAVEVRVPYLDHLFIEHAAKIPPEFKILGRKQKYILKKVAERIIPKPIIWRKKAGFGAPIGAWLRGQAREMMMDLLSETVIKRRGYFHYATVKKMIDDHVRKNEYNANQLWQLMTLELWHQEFIDKNETTSAKT